jgi:lipopolysaccharide/colanic/teichoic acid biosynthesis glycosyltransferase
MSRQNPYPDGREIAHMPEPATIVGFCAGMTAMTTHLARRYFEIAKECLDVVLGTIAFILALPLMSICALIIKLSSKGPVLYTQIRVGKDGELFRMYKLRTMHPDAETEGAVWAKPGDPRVIKACRWMRSSHMDELPQILNVMKGEMSLVGPRPERPEILEELEKYYPHVRRRLAVLPGITGLAQVRNGYDTSVEEFRGKLTADLEYISTRKWSNEIRIMASTLTKVYDKKAH